MKRIIPIFIPSRGSPLLPAAFALLFLAGCATTPKAAPELAIQSAEQAIGNAERARAARTAGVELGEARDKLVSAQSALRDKNRVGAERYAHEARVDADLAIAKNEANKARKVNDGMRKSTQEIEQEMQRGNGARK